VSKAETSDTHFFNSFSLVLGILIFIAILIFAFARWIGHEQLEEQMTQPIQQSAVQQNIAPLARVAIAGKDNSALAVATTPTSSAPAQDVPKTGKEAFDTVCTSCHTLGLNGAPKIGDHAAWGPRIAQGKAVLYQAAINGLRLMPPRGGTTWPDATIREAVDYMVSLNK